MFKKKLSEWSMLPAEVEVTHFYGTLLVFGKKKDRNLKRKKFEKSTFCRIGKA
jgi:hypothetical protein